MDIGRARLRAEGDYPTGADDGRGMLTSDGREFAFQFVQVATRRSRSRPATSWTSWTSALRARHRAQRAVPQPDKRVVLATAATPHTRSHLRARRGGDDGFRHRRDGCRGGRHTARVASPVTVVLDGGELVIDVAGDLRIEMTGWARPVYAGTLSEEFLKELNATE